MAVDQKSLRREGYTALAFQQTEGVLSVAVSSLTLFFECGASEKFIDQAGSIWHQWFGN